MLSQIKKQIIEIIKVTGPLTKNKLFVILGVHYKRKGRIGNTIDELIASGHVIYMGKVAELDFQVAPRLNKQSQVYGVPEHKVKIAKFNGEKAPPPYRPAFEPLHANSSTYRQQSYRDR